MEIDNFKRDRSFQAKLKISSEIEFFNLWALRERRTLSQCPKEDRFGDFVFFFFWAQRPQRLAQVEIEILQARLKFSSEIESLMAVIVL